MSEYPYADQIKDHARLEHEQGLDAGRQLSKYQGVLNLRKEQAMEIIGILWKDAPMPDKMAAAALCASYHLNPLAGHVFLIPFEDKRNDGTTWTRVIGIKATRLLASRRGAFSYEDFSPRLMTADEQVKVWGKIDTGNICYITIVKDCRTGAQAYGFGKWPKEKEVQGAGKGNSKENMAAIRSERQALERLRPGEMPEMNDVVDEHFVDGEYREMPHEADTVIEIEEVKRQAEKDINELWPESPKPAQPLQDEQGGQETSEPIPFIPPTTLQGLLTWWASHGKEFTASRLCKEANVRTVNEIKDIPATVMALMATYNWKK